MSLGSNRPSAVGHAIDVLLGVLLECRKEPKPIAISTGRMIIGVLYYFCHSNDVIPDYSPGDGFDDDAFAINYFLSVVRRSDKKGFQYVAGLIAGRLDAS